MIIAYSILLIKHKIYITFLINFFLASKNIEVVLRMIFIISSKTNM